MGEPRAATVNGDFMMATLRAVAICGTLLLLPAVAYFAEPAHRLSMVSRLVNAARNGDLNADDLNALAAGYYEALQNRAHLDLGNWSRRNDYIMRNDFLLFEFKPNVNHMNGEGLRFTNSLGMPNPAYGPEKPAHTRRIAVLGDSVSVGPYGHSYEMLLEHKLNECCKTAEIRQYQVLNFSVPGYITLQKMDVALGRAKAFHPDVYAMALTVRDMHGLAEHLATLEVDGTDLKYGYLKQIVTEAGVRPSDGKRAIVDKLDPYWKQITTWALEQVRDSAKAEGAKTIVFLIPMPRSLTTQQRIFEEFDNLANSAGIPVVDVGRAFTTASNLEKVQLVPGDDEHPNIRGHEMIFRELYSRLQAQPDAMNALIGR